MADTNYEALRTAFTASVSHELRTPLARLQALLDSAELPGADLEALLARAREEVGEMTNLVDDILFLSELEQGREVVALGETEAAPVLRALVVENLLENSLRYAGEGATCTISLGRENGEVVLDVADDGTGVPDEDVPRLFERFFRSDRARTTRGTGLGLALVMHVVESAGGNVEDRGGRGRGLDVRCAFPA